MKVDVVIPVADRNGDIERKCIDHLERTQDYPYNLILIEDRSPGFSFGKSVNRGMREAQSDVVMVMDSDAFPALGAMSSLLSFAQKHQSVGYIGARISISSGPTCGWIYTRNPYYLLRIAIRDRAPLFALRKIRSNGLFGYDIAGVDRLRHGIIGQATTFCGIRRQCWSDVGGFDERFRVLYSDIDFCLNVLFSDRWAISTCEAARADHVEHATRKSLSGYNENSLAGKELFDRKWPHEKLLEAVKASKSGKFLLP